MLLENVTQSESIRGYLHRVSFILRYISLSLHYEIQLYWLIRFSKQMIRLLRVPRVIF